MSGHDNRDIDEQLKVQYQENPKSKRKRRQTKKSKFFLTEIFRRWSEKQPDHYTMTSRIYRFLIGWVALLTFLGTMAFTSSSTIDAQIASKGYAVNVVAGYTMDVAADNVVSLMPQDYIVEVNSDADMGRMLIWDFAAEDGDVVQIEVNGQIVMNSVPIRNEPVMIEIPFPSTVRIIGLRDGQGGITYGVKFPGNTSGQVYFNVAPEGEANTYTVNGGWVG